jgi:hypothetical protein
VGWAADGDPLRSGNVDVRLSSKRPLCAGIPAVPGDGRER